MQNLLESSCGGVGAKLPGDFDWSASDERQLLVEPLLEFWRAAGDAPLGFLYPGRLVVSSVS